MKTRFHSEKGKVMKGSKVFEFLTNGNTPVVRFNKLIEEAEADFDENMMARLIQASNMSDGTIKVVFDFADYEQHNISYMKPNYWDENNQPTLRWIDTKYYPKDKKLIFYIDMDQEAPFEILQNNLALSDYQQSGSKLEYVQWLEEQYLLKK